MNALCEDNRNPGFDSDGMVHRTDGTVHRTDGRGKLSSQVSGFLFVPKKLRE